jgi:hypothetical protein
MKAREKTTPQLGLLLALLLIAIPGCRPSEDENDVAVDSTTVAENAGVDALDEWQATLAESGADSAGGGLQIVVEKDGLHVNGGPGGMLWRDADLAQQGNYRWTADFQSATGGEYGVLVGGKNLTFPDREYTSFLVRSSGDYRIERREGDEMKVLVDWTPVVGAANAAPVGTTTGRATGVGTTAAPKPGPTTTTSGGIAPPPATDRTTAPATIGPSGGSAPASPTISGRAAPPMSPAGPMTLGVTVEGEDVQFRVDGTLVKSLPATEVEPYGLAGLRLGNAANVVVKKTALDGMGVGQKP